MSQLTLGQALHSAVQHHQAGRLAEAEALYRQILAAKPDQVDALNLYGVLATQAGKVDIGISLLRRALALKPDFAGALINLASALILKNQLDEAADSLNRALALEPHSTAAVMAMVSLFKERGHLQEAMDWYQKALTLQPDWAAAHSGVAYTLVEMGRSAEALASFERAIALEPDLADAHYGYAMTLLRLGRLAEGWREYEWRWKSRQRVTPRGELPGTRWDGSDLHGQRILLSGEQGLGDVIQFIRYAPLVARRGGHVIVDCQPDLRPLIRKVSGVHEVITWDQPLPPYDVHCPLMSLPIPIGTTLETIPWEGAYLQPEPDAIGRWRTRIGNDGRKIGLAWAGSAKHRYQRERSIAFGQLASLAQINGTRFFSLQKGEAAKEALPPGLDLTDFTTDLKDFGDTAALVANLDLIITVDTAVAHLAGALGKPVWLLVASVADWRWLENRTDTPWYPTMRIFRQKTRGNWEDVIHEVQDALTQMAK